MEYNNRHEPIGYNNYCYFKMSQLSTVVRLVGIAGERESVGDSASAEAAWKAARIVNSEIFFPGQKPGIEIGPVELVPAAELFGAEEIVSPPPGLNDSNHLTGPPDIGEYRPLSLRERTLGVVAGVFGLAAKTTRKTLDVMGVPPDVTIGNIAATALTVTISGPGWETHRVSSPTESDGLGE